MRAGIVVFPGSNCDHDALHACGAVFGMDAVPVWHKDEALPDGLDLVFLPGGFSFGDYLRSGAIARFSPVMREVVRFAEGGGLVLGVCNGFQVLCEAGLLPGALLRNRSLRFRCHEQHARVENAATPFTNAMHEGQVLNLPLAHGDGLYMAPDSVLDELEATGRVVFRYCDAQGNVTDAANPNGSARGIAGVVNARGNVLGMMPHPERHVETLLGPDDGAFVFRSLLAAGAREANADVAAEAV